MTETESRFALYDDLLSPVAVVEGGVFIYFNQAFAQFLQLPPRKIRGKPLAEVLQNEGLHSYLSGGVTPETTVGAGDAKKEVVLKLFPVDGGAVVVTLQDFSIERILHKKHRAQLDEIKKYSEGLEVLVEQRTAELRSEKEQTEGILRSIREGLFVVEKDLTVGTQCSAAAFAMLGRDTLSGVKALDVLFPGEVKGAAAEARKKLGDFFAGAFNLFIPEQFEDLVAFAPKCLRFQTERGSPRLFSVSYSAVVDRGEIARLVVALRDDTELEELRRHAVLVHRRVVEALSSLSARGGAVARFVSEAEDLVGRVVGGLKDLAKADVDELFRLLHTIKGGARQHKLAFLEHFAHEAENVLDLFRSGREVEAERLSRLAHDVGSLELGVHALASLTAGRGASASPERAFLEYLRSLEESAVSLAAELGKSVRFEQDVTAVPTEEELALLGKVLGHLVRNALDHGIEPAAERLGKGKPAAGTLKLILHRNGDLLQGSLADDGRGIDLVALGLEARSGDVLEQALRLLARPGFTTKTGVTEISGRGVGLDAVSSEIEGRGGRLVIARTGEGGTVFAFTFQASASSVVKAS